MLDARARRTAEMLAVVLLGTLAYSNTFGVPFHFDDVSNLLMRQDVRNLGWSSVLAVPTDARAFGLLTFQVNYALHGFDVFGYHAVNLAIHLATALLVYDLAGTTFRAARRGADAGPGDRLAALTAALLFVAHPLQTQAVTYVVQRYASLAALLYVAALLLYARSRLRGWDARGVAGYAASLACGLLAMRTKQIAFTLPFAILLYEAVFFDGKPRERILRLVPHLLTLAVIPLPILLAAASSSSGGAALAAAADATRVQTDIPRLTYLLTQLRVIVMYLRLLVFPAGQNIDYDFPLHDSLDGEVLLSGVFLGSIAALGAWLAWNGRKTARAEHAVAGFGILFLFVALAVESSIIPIVDLVMEHRMYLPSAGVFMAVGAGVMAAVGWAAPRWSRASPLATGAVAVVAAVLAIATWQRNEVWATPVSLWADSATKSPNKLRPLINLTEALEKAGDPAAAVPYMRRAVLLRPSTGDEQFAQGDILRKLGDMAGAQRVWRATVAADPQNSRALNGLGIFALFDEDWATAVSYFERALQGRSYQAEVHANLAMALEELGRTDEAVQHYLEFVRTASPMMAREVERIRAMLAERYRVR